MTQRYYPARICEDEGSYLFQAIDIPEAISAGDTPEQALNHGIEALQLAIETWDDKRDGPLPDPTPLDQAMRKLDKQQRRGLVAIQLVPVADLHAAIKISVTLPGDLLKRIDATAGNYGRSGFLAQAAREKLAGGQHGQALYGLPPEKRASRAMMLKEPKARFVTKRTIAAKGK